MGLGGGRLGAGSGGGNAECGGGMRGHAQCAVRRMNAGRNKMPMRIGQVGDRVRDDYSHSHRIRRLGERSIDRANRRSALDGASISARPIRNRVPFLRSTDKPTTGTCRSIRSSHACYRVDLCEHRRRLLTFDATRSSAVLHIRARVDARSDRLVRNASAGARIRNRSSPGDPDPNSAPAVDDDQKVPSPRRRLQPQRLLRHLSRGQSRPAVTLAPPHPDGASPRNPPFLLRTPH